MLDIRFLRQDPDGCRERLAVRGDPELTGLLERALEADARRRGLIADVEVLKAERNARSRAWLPS